MYGAEFVKRVPVRDRNGNHRHDSIGRPMFKQVYDPPENMRPALAREADRRKTFLRRNDVEIARAAEQFGQAESAAFHRGAAQAGMRGLAQIVDRKIAQGDHPMILRELMPNRASRDPEIRKKPNTVRQSVAYALATEMGKANDKAMYGYVDPGERARNYWRGFASQVGELREPGQRHRLGNMMDYVQRGYAHPANVAQLAGSTDIHEPMRYAENLHSRGYIREPAAQRKFALREVIRGALRKHQPVRVAMSGRVVRQPIG